jgi:hypothetical protein
MVELPAGILPTADAGRAKMPLQARQQERTPQRQPDKIQIPEITPALKEKIKRYARDFMLPDRHYTKGDIMNEICKHVLGDYDRARLGFYLLAKTKAIDSIFSGRYFLNC